MFNGRKNCWTRQEGSLRIRARFINDEQNFPGINLQLIKRTKYFRRNEVIFGNAIATFIGRGRGGAKAVFP